MSDEIILYPTTAKDDCAYWILGSTWHDSDLFCCFGQVIGLRRNSYIRFLNTGIPPGSTIESCIIKFYSYNSVSYTPVKALVYFEDADDPAKCTDADDAEGRDLTASISFTVSSRWVGNNWYSSPELKTIFQSIVDRAGFASDSHITAFVYDNVNPNSRLRYFDNLGHAGYYPPRLYVTYSEGGSDFVPQPIIF